MINIGRKTESLANDIKIFEQGKRVGPSGSTKLKSDGLGVKGREVEHEKQPLLSRNVKRKLG
jgi:hypothetical protein